MKYKIGDKVRIKSLDWYNENKDTYGSVYAGNGFGFFKYMTRHCGEIMKIDVVKVDPEDSNKGYYFMENSEERWTDEMIEGLAYEIEITQDIKAFSEGYDHGYVDGQHDMNEWILPEGFEFHDENGNVINTTKIVLKKKSPKTDDVIKWLREHDMNKYIGVLCSGVCSITFDTEKLIKDINETIGDE